MKSRMILLIVTFLFFISVKPMLRGAHFVSEKALGPRHEVTVALEKPLHKWVVVGIEQTLGRSDPEAAQGLVNLIEVYMDPEKKQEYMDRFRQAEEFSRASSPGSPRAYQPSESYRY